MATSWRHSVLDRHHDGRRGCVSERRVPTLSGLVRPSQASDLDIFDDRPLRVPINCGTRVHRPGHVPHRTVFHAAGPGRERVLVVRGRRFHVDHPLSLNDNAGTQGLSGVPIRSGAVEMPTSARPALSQRSRSVDTERGRPAAGPHEHHHCRSACCRARCQSGRSVHPRC